MVDEPAGPDSATSVPPCAPDEPGPAGSLPDPTLATGRFGLNEDGSPTRWPCGKQKGIQKVHYTHEAMIECMIAHPEWTQRQIAEYFGYSEVWICNIIASDAFREQMVKRKDEIINPVLKANVEERFNSNLRMALDLIQARLSTGVVSDNFLLRTTEMSARALGLGAPKPPAPTTPNMHLHLHEMSERLTALLAQKRGTTIDSEPTNG